jgi:hypothetical protein
MKNSHNQGLPWVCPHHQTADIRHEWNRTVYLYGGGWPMGNPVDSGHQYFCSVCGQELTSEVKNGKDY